MIHAINYQLKVLSETSTELNLIFFAKYPRQKYNRFNCQSLFKNFCFLLPLLSRYHSYHFKVFNPAILIHWLGVVTVMR